MHSISTISIYTYLMDKCKNLTIQYEQTRRPPPLALPTDSSDCFFDPMVCPWEHLVLTAHLSSIEFPYYPNRTLEYNLFINIIERAKLWSAVQQKHYFNIIIFLGFASIGLESVSLNPPHFPRADWHKFESTSTYQRRRMVIQFEGYLAAELKLSKPLTEGERVLLSNYELPESKKRTIPQL